MCFVFVPPILLFTASFLCLSVDKNPVLSISVRAWFESKSTSAHILMDFYFDVRCFILILSVGKGVSLICIGNVRTKLSRIAFLKLQ